MHLNRDLNFQLGSSSELQNTVILGFLLKYMQHPLFFMRNPSYHKRTCMYDPYPSTHTIITVTAKKCDYVAPRLGTCMYGIYDPYPAPTPPSQSLPKSVTFLPPDLGPECMTPISVFTPPSPSLQKDVNFSPPDLSPLYA